MTQIPRVAIIALTAFGLGAFALSLPFPVQHAEAASMTFLSDTTITSDETIGPGEKSIVDSGVTLTIASGISITVDNGGTIFNGGTINNTGTIDNTGGIGNEGTINNFRGVIGNGGTINNDGGVIFNSDRINNFGTFINECHGMLNNSGIFTGNAVINEPCVYLFGLFEGIDPSDFVLDLGQEATAIAQTDDPEVSQVILSWIDPSANVETEIVPVLSAERVRFTPDEVGTWTVIADFGNGEVIQQTMNVDFLVIPESPIGMVALMASSFLALGGFMFWKRRSKPL